MNMNRTIMIAAGALTLTGCVGIPSIRDLVDPAPQQVQLYDPAQVAFSKGEGTATVMGSAFVPATDGFARNCGGTRAALIPQSDYADERMAIIYGSNTRGYVSVSDDVLDRLQDGDAQYVADQRMAVCDQVGRFTFQNLPAGTYYVTADVTWSGSLLRYGGYLMERITVSEGGTQTVTLAP